MLKFNLQFCKHAMLLLMGIAFAPISIHAKSLSPSNSPSLSVGHFIDSLVHTKRARAGVRGQLVSELTQMWDCTVQTRWHGLELVTENSIASLAYIDSLQVPAEGIPSADYVIAGHYFNYTKGSPVTTGTVYCSTVSMLLDDKVQERGFKASSPFEMPRIISESVGKMLGLSPRTNIVDQTGAVYPKDLVWVILPLQRFSLGFKNEVDRDISWDIERELIRSNSVKNLVERDSLNDILREHKMGQFEDGRYGNSRVLSHLVKADVLLTGQIARESDKGKYRIDLLLIDANSGAVLSAVTSRNVAEDRIKEKTVALARQLAQIPISTPKLGTATDAERRREADILMSRRHYPEYTGGAFYFDRVRSELESAVNAAEGAYILSHEDDEYVYDVMIQLLNRYMERKWWNFKRPGDSIQRMPFRNLLCMQRTAALMDSALRFMEHSPNTPCPLIYRAMALMYAGRYDEAIRLTNLHMHKHPALEKGNALEILAESHFRLGKHDEALEYAKRAMALGHSTWSTQYIIEDLESQRIRENLSSAQGKGKQDQFAAYRKMLDTQGYKSTGKDWQEYLTLMRSTKDVKYCMDLRNIAMKDASRKFLHRYYPDELSRQSSNTEDMLACGIKSDNEGLFISYWIHYHMAWCYAQIGEHEKAVRRVKDVIAASESVKWAWGRNRVLKDIHTEADKLRVELENKHGSVAEFWKTYADMPFPDDYHIYLASTTKGNEGVVRGIMKHLDAFFGTGVVVRLPRVDIGKAIPRNSNGNYVMADLYEAFLHQIRVPDDAVHVFLLTDHPVRVGGKAINTLFCHGMLENLYEPSVLSPSVLAYYYLLQGNKGRKHQLLAMMLISQFRYIYAEDWTEEQSIWRNSTRTHYGYNKAECQSYSCVFSSSTVRQIQQNRRLSMCPDCQKDFADLDFAEMNRELLTTLRTTGATIVPADDYRSKALSNIDK